MVIIRILMRHIEFTKGIKKERGIFSLPYLSGCIQATRNSPKDIKFRTVKIKKIQNTIRIQ